MFGRAPRYSYRVHLTSGSHIDVKNCKDLEIRLEGGKLVKYEFTFFNAADINFRYIAIEHIVAIEKI